MAESGKPKRKRVNARRATLAVLEILKAHSSETRPMKIWDIQWHLKKEYELEPTRETVGDILGDLWDFYGEDVIGRQNAIRRSGYGYTYNYYYKRPLPEEGPGENPHKT